MGAGFVPVTFAGLQGARQPAAFLDQCFAYVSGKVVTPQDYAGSTAIGAGGDDTAVFQAALNAATTLCILPGTYKVGALTVPATVRRIIGAGVEAVTFTANGTIATGMFNINGATALEMAGFSVTMSPSTYAAVPVFNLGTVSRMYLHDVLFNSAGAAAVSGGAVSVSTFERLDINNWAVIGINLVGSRNVVRACSVSGSGAQTSHNIQLQNGADNWIVDCYGTNNVSGAFVGVLYNCVGGGIAECTAVGGVAEGFNFQNCWNCVMANNVVRASLLSVDFGLSLFGDSVPGTTNGQCLNCVVIGNSVYAPGKAGIAFASNVVGCSAIGNRIFSPNQINQAQWGGVTLYGGSICNNNVVQGNSVYDTTAKCKYAANEYNDGTGNPNNNQLLDNPVQATGLTAETAILGANSITSQIGWSSFATVVTPTATPGAFSATVNSFLYRIRGKTGEIQYDISVPTNSTGAGAIQFTLPTGFDAATNGGMIPGREVTAGSGTNAQCNAGGALIRTYNNLYPAADGYRLIGSGIYKLA